MYEIGEKVEYWLNGKIETGEIISIAMNERKDILLYEIANDSGSESNLIYPQYVIE